MAQLDYQRDGANGQQQKGDVWIADDEREVGDDLLQRAVLILKLARSADLGHVHALWLRSRVGL